MATVLGGEGLWATPGEGPNPPVLGTYVQDGPSEGPGEVGEDNGGDGSGGAGAGDSDGSEENTGGGWWR